MVVAYKGQHYLLPEHRPAKFERINQTGLHEAGYGPVTQFVSGRFVVKDGMVTSDGRTTKGGIEDSVSIRKPSPRRFRFNCTGMGNRQMISEARALRPTPPTCRNC